MKGYQTSVLWVVSGADVFAGYNLWCVPYSLMDHWFLNGVMLVALAYATPWMVWELARWVVAVGRWWLGYQAPPPPAEKTSEIIFVDDST